MKQLKQCKKYVLYISILFGLFFIPPANATNNEEKSSVPIKQRVIYIKNITPTQTLEKTYYVGQTISISYEILLFEGATIKSSTFQSDTNDNNILLKNKDQQFQQTPTKTHHITYNFKLKSSKAIIPPLEVVALLDDGEDFAVSPAINLKIIDLAQNDKYAGVVGNEVRLGIYKTRHYDDEHNLLVFELFGEGANLEDFRLPNVERFGVERSYFSDGESSGIFYCVIPRTIQQLDIQYFSLKTNHFEQIQIPIVLDIETNTNQSDLNPKKLPLRYPILFGSLIILGLIVGAFVFEKAYIKLACLALALITLGGLLFEVFYTKKIIIEANKFIWVLPTNNATLLETTQRRMEVRIVGENDKYYKIITPENKTGWIRKGDVK